MKKGEFCNAIKVSQKSMNFFLSKNGTMDGAGSWAYQNAWSCTSSIFYAAYVFFEKKRIAEGKPKSQHQLAMEELWAGRGGFDREHDGRTGYLVTAGKSLYMDQYGLMHTY
ncbi:uncharacterized protein F4812DRAFT_457781 [Daldinia caldariorum]|uniref:uncharacterized protein n=1 Tax=Daldinia caldariorum TaxID=326644 RepID=UPI002007ABCC|nr:uncharacterized protein F4812DRAFT_457781 [Daldinia caldariorum]KAI1469242.1 hypothetical protein F4812DRAFT_457781 [Daldinia caldariorum]